MRLERATNSVLNRMRAPRPKLHSFRFQPIPAPVRWKRDPSFGETLFQFFETSIENSACVDHLALVRRPSPKLRAERPGMKVFLRFFARSFFHFPLDPDLPL